MKNTWVELDLDALSANLAVIRGALGRSVRLIVVVKANAYGHGMIPVARHAWSRGARWFAVAHLEEAVALRRCLPAAEILILGAIRAGDALEAARLRVVPVLSSETHARSLSAALAGSGAVLRCHAKVDTGMGRLGLPWESADRVLPALARLPGLALDGICSHFAASAAADRSFADQQYERFRRAAEACEAAGMGRLFRHITNSGGSFRDPAWQLDGVRPGLALYGYNPGLADEEDETGPGPAALRALRPILQWKTRVVQVRRVPEGFPVSYDSTWRAPRDTCLATLDAGYADGYFRSHGNQSHVVIRGRRRPVAGRVTMNLLMVDAGPEGDVREDDEALLIGEQDGACVWADELAALARTIPYEVLTSIRTDEVRTKGGGASHA